MTATSGEIAQGFNEGARRARVQFNDLRLRIIYIVIVVLGISFAWLLQNEIDHVKDAQHAARLVCEQTNISDTKFNQLLDQLAINIQNSTTLTASQKAQALQLYGSVHRDLADCSKLAGK